MKIRIEEIKPTHFFIIKDNQLRNLVHIIITNEYKEIEAKIVLKWLSKHYEINLGTLKKGKHKYEVQFPYIDHETKIKLILYTKDRKVKNEIEFLWKPKRLWKIFVVQFSHHDLGYTNLPQNALDEYIKIYDYVTKSCKETENYPKEAQFKYQVEQLWSLLHYLKTQPPSKCQEIINLIKQGRVGISALFANEVTELCGHEELIRLIYPYLMLKRKYGVETKVAQLNDIPGLSWGLVPVLAKSGIKYFVPYLPRGYYKPDEKPFWEEKLVAKADVPKLFRWVGADGSYIYVWYGNIRFSQNIQELIKILPKELERLEKEGYPYDAVLVQIWCGDNYPPTVKYCDLAKEWNKKWAYPRIIISTLSDFFDYIEEKYGDLLKRTPVFRGEIPDSDYVVGATSTAKATLINRINHDLIPTAEKFSTIASMLGSKYSFKKLLDKAYEHMILYDEHTWGFCDVVSFVQEASRFEKEIHAYKATNLAYDVLIKSLYEIAEHINLLDGYYIVIFNALPWKRDDIVRIPLKLFSPCNKFIWEVNEKGYTITKGVYILKGKKVDFPKEVMGEFRIIDLTENKEVPYQIHEINDVMDTSLFSAERYTVNQSDGRDFYPIDHEMGKELILKVNGIPPLGYKVYKIVSGKASKGISRLLVSRNKLENEFYKIVVDEDDGIVSIYDKELGIELVDQSSELKFNQVIAREIKTCKIHTSKIKSIKVLEKGSLAGSILIKGYAPSCSLLSSKVTLYAGIKMIELSNKIIHDNTSHIELFIAFPFNIKKADFTYEGPLSIIKPFKDQFPGSRTDYYAVQHWISVYDKERDFSITLCPEGSHLVMFGGMWPTRVSWAHHCITPPNYMDQYEKPKVLKGHVFFLIINNNFRTNFYLTQVSEITFRYFLTSCKGSWKESKAWKFGLEKLTPLVPIYVKGPKKGFLPLSYSFCNIEKDNVILLTMKISEDNSGIIMRFFETKGVRTTTKVRLPFLNKIKEIAITNLLEEEISKLPSVYKNEFVLSINPFEVVTVKIKY